MASGMTGFDFVRNIREYEKRAKKEPAFFAAVTGFVDSETEAHATESGFNILLEKPLRKKDFEQLFTGFA